MSDPRFKAVLAELQAMHDRKGADYGKTTDPYNNVRASEDWGIEPWVGAMVRLSDKVRRLQKAAQGGTLANESVEDSLLDIPVYAIIALILYREATAPKVVPPFAPNNYTPIPLGDELIERYEK